MDPPPASRRRECCCGRMGWAIALVTLISIILLSFSAAAYQHMHELALDPDLYVQPSHDNIIVVVQGFTFNLGEGTGYNFEEQAKLLWSWADSSEKGLEYWYLESDYYAAQQEDRKREESLDSKDEWSFPERRQLHQSTSSPKLPPLPSKIVPSKPQLPPIPSDIRPIVPSGDKLSIPTDVLNHDPDPDMPTDEPLPPTGFLPPLPSNVGEGEVLSSIDEPAISQVTTALGGDSHSPIGKNPRPTTNGIDVAAPRGDPPPFKLPGFIQLPSKLIAILKRVVSRLATNASLPNEIRAVLRVVLHILDRISNGPTLPIPTSVTRILPTLTRPPIGKKPTLPPLPPLPPLPTTNPVITLPPVPLPTTTRTGLPIPPIRPPPPGKGKLPHLPPGKGKLPRPPGKGKRQSVEPLSGFIEVTRRAATTTNEATAGDGDDDDHHNNQGPIELLGKRPLTKKQRQWMMSQASVLMHEEVEREREKHPDDPLNDLIGVPTCMAVFNRIARHAERWMGRQDAEERRAIEESVVEVGDDEDWDYGEGEWF